MRVFFGAILIVQFVVLVPIEAQGEGAHRSEQSVDLSPRTDFNAGLYGLYNPTAGAVFFESVHSYPYAFSSGYDDVWSKWGIGGGVVLCPTYSSAGVLVEWMPALFAVLRLRYDAFFYHGHFGAVLSYDSIPTQFMESDLTDRWGDEEAAFGQRLFLQPTLRGQVGKVYFQNQTDALWYDTYAAGPYVFNWDYETFIERRDFIIETRTDVMLEVQRGCGETRFMIGPSHTLTYAVRTRLRRQRFGISVYWVPRDLTEKPGYLYLGIGTGVNIEAVLEERSPYLVFVVGGAWTRVRAGRGRR